MSLFLEEEMGQGVVRQSYNRLAIDAVIDRLLDMLVSRRNPISQTYEIQCEIRTSI